jgi:DNA topoisomerase IA
MPLLLLLLHAAAAAAACCCCCIGDCVLKKTKAVLAGGGETFTASGSVVLRPGFTAIMPWKVRDFQSLHKA